MDKSSGVPVTAATVPHGGCHERLIRAHGCTQAADIVTVTLRLIAYDRRFSRASFDSGSAALDVWLREQATQAERRGNCRTVLAIDESRQEVAGYVSLVTFQLLRDEVAMAVGVGASRYPMPAVLIARLAVDRRHQRKGLGTLLLHEALRRSMSIADLAGCEVVVVQAIDLDAAAYYCRFGFRAFRADSLRLWLPMRDVRRTLQTGIS